VVTVGATVIAAVVLPLFQKYVPPPLAASVALEPAQMIPSLLVIPDVSDTVTETEEADSL
jgi:hypothetical protein